VHGSFNLSLAQLRVDGTADIMSSYDILDLTIVWVEDDQL
jgi:hypothetical protein